MTCKLQKKIHNATLEIAFYKNKFILSLKMCQTRINKKNIVDIDRNHQIEGQGNFFIVINIICLIFRINSLNTEKEIH